MFDIIYQLATFIEAIFSIVAAGIAIYLYIFKRKYIASILDVLFNYSVQISLSELRTKLDRLNEMNANDKEQHDDVINIFNEIEGQMRGNKVLKEKCNTIFKQISKYTENPNDLTEPKKRSIVSELRETLRTIDFQNYDEIVKRKHE